jgi:hypothetical protein
MNSLYKSNWQRKTNELRIKHDDCAGTIVLYFNFGAICLESILTDKKLAFLVRGEGRPKFEWEIANVLYYVVRPDDLIL